MKFQRLFWDSQNLRCRCQLSIVKLVCRFNYSGEYSKNRRKQNAPAILVIPQKYSRMARNLKYELLRHVGAYSIVPFIRGRQHAILIADLKYFCFIILVRHSFKNSREVHSLTSEIVLYLLQQELFF